MKCCVPGTFLEPANSAPTFLNLHWGNQACLPQWVQASGSVSGNFVRLFVKARSKYLGLAVSLPGIDQSQTAQILMQNLHVLSLLHEYPVIDTLYQFCGIDYNIPDNSTVGGLSRSDPQASSILVCIILTTKFAHSSSCA